MADRWVRFWAGVGCCWLVLFAVFAISARVPLAWRLAYLEYTSIGIVALAGVWQGRHLDPSWRKRMSRAQWLGFALAGILFFIGVFA